MRMVFLVLVLTACGDLRQTHRWPEHRRDKDAEIDALTRQTTALETRVRKLEQLLDQSRPAVTSGAGCATFAGK